MTGREIRQHQSLAEHPNHRRLVHLRSKSFGLTQEGAKGLVGPSGCVIRTVIMFELNGTLSAKKVL